MKKIKKQVKELSGTQLLLLTLILFIIGILFLHKALTYDNPGAKSIIINTFAGVTGGFLVLIFQKTTEQGGFLRRLAGWAAAIFVIGVMTYCILTFI